MQLRFFQIPVGGDDSASDELNRFLRTHRVLQVDRQLVSREGGASWAVCVEYLVGEADEKKSRSSVSERKKIDYREVLSEEDFAVFARLRALRK